LLVNNTVRILQITDCHLPASPDIAYRGINSHESLLHLLKSVDEFAAKFAPDFILATGDLSEDGSPASYLWLQEYLGEFGVPVLALPGNHDDPEMLAETYADSPVDDITVSEHGEWQLIRMNTTLPGTPAGAINETSLASLEQVLGENKERPRLIALHHQPVPVGSPWIDKYRLQEPEEFLTLIDQCEGVKAVVWGHVHQVFAESRNGIAMYSGPSSARNGIPGKQEFTADTMGPACRWIELCDEGVVRTGIITA
jgi:Icc protein